LRRRRRRRRRSFAVGLFWERACVAAVQVDGSRACIGRGAAD
jgi:hypothetical protein